MSIVLRNCLAFGLSTSLLGACSASNDPTPSEVEIASVKEQDTYVSMEVILSVEEDACSRINVTCDKKNDDSNADVVNCVEVGLTYDAEECTIIRYECVELCQGLPDIEVPTVILLPSTDSNTSGDSETEETEISSTTSSSDDTGSTSTDAVDDTSSTAEETGGDETTGEDPVEDPTTDTGLTTDTVITTG